MTSNNERLQRILARVAASEMTATEAVTEFIGELQVRLENLDFAAGNMHAALIAKFGQMDEWPNSIFAAHLTLMDAIQQLQNGRVPE